MKKYDIENPDFTIKDGIRNKLYFKQKELFLLKEFDTVFANKYGAVVEQFVKYKKQDEETYCYVNLYVYDKCGELVKTLKSIEDETCFDYKVRGNLIEFTETISGQKTTMQFDKENIHNQMSL